MKNTYKILASIIILLISSCKKQDELNTSSLNHNIMILGHRGMGEMYKYPGNSVEAILPVLGIGADGTEIDIQMTKDSVLVLYHNDLLDTRTTCTGKIVNKNWSEIRNCKYNLTWAIVPLCTVDSLFSLIKNLNEVYFSFDIKLDEKVAYSYSYRAKILRAIKKIEDKYNMSNNIIIEGDKEFLLQARELGLKNKECIVNAGSFEKNIECAIKYNFYCVGGDATVNEMYVKKAHDNGIRFMVWNAKNIVGNTEALKKGIDIIQTDAPSQILQQINRYDYEYIIP